MSMDGILLFSPSLTLTATPISSPVASWTICPVSRGSPAQSESDDTQWCQYLVDELAVPSSPVRPPLESEPLPSPPQLVQVASLVAPSAKTGPRPIPWLPSSPAHPERMVSNPVRPQRQFKLPAERAPKSFPCLDLKCRKKFDRKSTWEKHMLSHTGVQGHHCKYCDKAFTLKSNRARHEKSCKSKREGDEPDRTDYPPPPPSGPSRPPPPSTNYNHHTHF